MSPGELVNCVFGMWSPTLGDPTAMGWVTVVCYLAAAVLAVFVFFWQTGRQRIFWLGLAIFLVALAVNKQLDLQSALTAAGRCMAQAQGWYEERRSVQVIFIVAIICFSFSVAVSSAWLLRRDLTEIWLALVGLAFLAAFIAVRAAGFHHFDQFIDVEFGSVRMNWALELGGIFAVIINALYLLLRGNKTTR